MNIVNYLAAIIIGFFTGLMWFFVFTAFGPTLKTTGFIVATVIALLALVCSTFFFTEGEGRRSTAIIVVLFVVFTSYTSCFLMDSFMGKADWKYPFYHPVPGDWSLANEEEWNFLEPRCATSSYARGNQSIQVADFYYREIITYNPYHSIPQSLYDKLTCGIALSSTAYQDYKERLDNQGFEIKENSSSSRFTATNNTTAVYCYLDGKHLVVAKATKDNMHLLNNVREKVRN